MTSLSKSSKDSSTPSCSNRRRSIEVSRGAEAVLHTLGVYLFEFVDEHVIDAIVGVLIARLTARKLRGQRPRRAVIYGPNKR
jgi:hypothetical protein